jgi:hypothetical protein
LSLNVIEKLIHTTLRTVIVTSALALSNTNTRAIAIAIAYTAITSAVLAAYYRPDLVDEPMNSLFFIDHKRSSLKANARPHSTVLTFLARNIVSVLRIKSWVASIMRIVLQVIILAGKILFLNRPIALRNHLSSLR